MSEPTEEPQLGQPPVAPPERPARRAAPSLVLVNTGDGKGKSTAAFGTALRAVARGWTVCVQGDYQLVVLDEFTYPMNWGWIDRAEVADTVTDMRKLRHAYDTGVLARRGIDF